MELRIQAGINQTKSRACVNPITLHKYMPQSITHKLADRTISQSCSSSLAATHQHLTFPHPHPLRHRHRRRHLSSPHHCHYHRCSRGPSRILLRRPSHCQPGSLRQRTLRLRLQSRGLDGRQFRRRWRRRCCLGLRRLEPSAALVSFVPFCFNGK